MVSREAIPVTGRGGPYRGVGYSSEYLGWMVNVQVYCFNFLFFHYSALHMYVLFIIYIMLQGTCFHCPGVSWLIMMGSRLDGWIYWHTYYNYSYLQSITIAHNQWLSKTRSIPYWTTSVFSSTVTDLVLIYESVTPSASAVRWLTLHSWTHNYSYERSNEFTNELSIL
jgi:hypothetical protein